MRSISKEWGERVFYNFPFDAEYRQLRNAVVFTIVACEFLPTCALDIVGSGKTRLSKIINLIHESRLSIHDLSRTESDKVTGHARFNMPFELGVCVGFQHSESLSESSDKSPRKRECLILIDNLDKYRACLSDLAGNDISVHKNNPKTAISVVRDWLDGYASSMRLGGERIHQMFEDFQGDLPRLCAKKQISIKELNYSNYVEIALNWFVALSIEDRQ